MWIMLPSCVLPVPLAAVSGAQRPRQSAGIVLDPASLISQSKKGFPVSELRARQDAVGVCATFPFSRTPHVQRYHAGEGRSGSMRPCVQIWHALNPVKGLGHMDYVTMERLCSEGTDCYEFKQSSKDEKWTEFFFFFMKDRVGSTRTHRKRDKLWKINDKPSKYEPLKDTNRRSEFL